MVDGEAQKKNTYRVAKSLNVKIKHICYLQIDNFSVNGITLMYVKVIENDKFCH
jgi:hypothetical protein